MDNAADRLTLIGNVALDVHVYPSGVGGAEDGSADVVIASGGSIVNHARALRALGRPAELLSFYADDAEGELIRSALHHEGLASDGLFSVLGRNNRTVLLLSASGDKRMWSDRGRAPSVEVVLNTVAGRAAQAKHLHVSPNQWSVPLVTAMAGKVRNVSADLHVLERLPGPEFLAALRVVFFSAVGQADIPRRMAELLAGGPELVVCTAGSDGCFVASQTVPGVRHYPAVRPGSDVVDTIGAGDILAATLLSYWYAGTNLHDALLRAQIQAAHSVTCRGLDQLLGPNELEQRAAIMADDPIS